MHEKLKRFSTLLSPPTRAASRGNGKVMAAMSSKRKASTDNLMQQQQPPLKKIATDGPGGVVPMNSMSVDNMQGSTSGFSSMMGFPNIGMSSSMGEYMCRIDPT